MTTERSITHEWKIGDEAIVMQGSSPYRFTVDKVTANMLLKEYKTSLDKEAKGVQERIKELERER